MIVSICRRKLIISQVAYRRFVVHLFQVLVHVKKRSFTLILCMCFCFHSCDKYICLFAVGFVCSDEESRYNKHNAPVQPMALLDHETHLPLVLQNFHNSHPPAFSQVPANHLSIFNDRSFFSEAHPSYEPGSAFYHGAHVHVPPGK